MLGVETVHDKGEVRPITSFSCTSWTLNSALRQRGLHFLQQAAEQCGITALPIH